MSVLPKQLCDGGSPSLVVGPFFVSDRWKPFHRAAELVSRAHARLGETRKVGVAFEFPRQ